MEAVAVMFAFFVGVLVGELLFLIGIVRVIRRTVEAEGQLAEFREALPKELRWLFRG